MTKIIWATDIRGRSVRCPICYKAVRINQKVVFPGDVPHHAKCVEWQQAQEARKQAEAQ